MRKLLIILICIILTLSLAVPASAAVLKYKDVGENIVRIQNRLRDLGYFMFKSTGNFQTMTVNAVIKFQEVNQLMSDGTIGDESAVKLFGTSAQRAPILESVKIPIGTTKKSSNVEVGSLTGWNEVNSKIPKNTSFQITDYNTGKQINVMRTGGTKHADVETETAGDTAIFLEMFGGQVNFSKRPVIVTINGARIAASLQGMPHGTDSVSMNDMDGHCDLYFYESLSDVANIPDVEHINQVYKAAGKE